MRYWTLFTLRVLARVGLSVAAILWVTGQQEQPSVAFDIGTRRTSVHTYASMLCVSNCRVKRPLLCLYDPEPPILDLPGLLVQTEPGDKVDIDIDHWFLCLTFLIATVATSVRWRKPAGSELEEQNA